MEIANLAWVTEVGLTLSTKLVYCAFVSWHAKMSEILDNWLICSKLQNIPLPTMSATVKIVLSHKKYLAMSAKMYIDIAKAKYTKLVNINTR
jgi:hypothetical protein